MKKFEIFENDSSIVNRIYKQDGRVLSFVDSFVEKYGTVVRWDAVHFTNAVGSTVIIYRVESTKLVGDTYCVIGVVLENGVVRDCTRLYESPSNRGVLKTDGIDVTLDRVQRRLSEIMSSDELIDKNLTGSDMVDIIIEATEGAVLENDLPGARRSVNESTQLDDSMTSVGELKNSNFLGRLHGYLKDIGYADDTPLSVYDVGGCCVVLFNNGGELTQFATDGHSVMMGVNNFTCSESEFLSQLEKRMGITQKYVQGDYSLLTQNGFMESGY